MDELREQLAWLLRDLDGDGHAGMMDEIYRQTADTILAEIDKTHRIMPRTPHGTLQKYTRGGCRCADCTRANRDWSRERRRRIKEAKGGQPQPLLWLSRWGRRRVCEINNTRFQSKIKATDFTPSPFHMCRCRRPT